MHAIRRNTIAIAGVVAALAAVAACADEALDPVDAPAAATAAMSMNPNGPAMPGGLATAAFGGGSLTVWPWTGKDFDGNIADPLNILFTGEVDVLSIRAALRRLDGNRTAFGLPDVFPFNCTWTDAQGEMQSAWSDQGGWVANPVQLQCGSYNPMRFHVRLFPAGGRVMAGTHLDLLIPGTPQHRVVSWELAEVLLTIDLIRSGVVDPATGVGHLPIGAAGPIGEVIPAAMYAALGSLQPLLNVVPDGSDFLPYSDGFATVFDVGVRTAVVPDFTESAFTIDFDQTIPRPFCNATDLVHVTGPVNITTRVQVNANGQLESHNSMRGMLDIVSIADGSIFGAHISQIDDTGVNAAGAHVNSVLEQKALPPGVGYLKTHLLTGPNGLAKSTRIERCE